MVVKRGWVTTKRLYTPTAVIFSLYTNEKASVERLLITPKSSLDIGQDSYTQFPVHDKLPVFHLLWVPRL